MCKGRDFPGGDAPRDLQILLGQMALTGEPGVMATVVSTDGSGPSRLGKKLILRSDGLVCGTVGGGHLEAQVLDAARRILKEGGCRLLSLQGVASDQDCSGEVGVFLEFLQQGSPFTLIGSGHVARAVLELGEKLPFHFTVVDDSADRLVDLEVDPGVATLVASPDQLRRQLAVVPDAAVLIATRSHGQDLAYLRAVLGAEDDAGKQVAFLGLLGSPRKVEKFRRKLAEDDRYAERLRRAQMPVGLDLGDATPQGIALSILAEALAVVNRRDFLVDDSGVALGLRLHRRRDG